MRSATERVAALFDSLQPASRRGFLSSGAKVAAGGGLALAVVTRTQSPSSAQEATPAENVPFAGPVDVLQYALTLEHLETAFYREGLETFAAQAFIDSGFQVSVREYLGAIAEHEALHVETLTGVISDLGEMPIAEGSYDFGYADLPSFLATAAAIENLGVNAYTGAARYLIDDNDLLTIALTIHGVEARHAAYLNLLTGAVPFPNAADAPQTPDEVLAIASPFVAGEGGTTPDASPSA